MKSSGKRAVAYLRESTQEQADGFSLDAQRQGIERLARDRGFALVAEYLDLNSGWRDSEGRPEFQRMMADAAAGRFEAVLVPLIPLCSRADARAQIQVAPSQERCRLPLGDAAESR